MNYELILHLPKSFSHMSLGTTELIWALVIAAILGGTLAYVFWRERKKVKKTATNKTDGVENKDVLQLQLQAYERLTLLAERIALPNLINRSYQAGVSAREMQFLLTNTIK